MRTLSLAFSMPLESITPPMIASLDLFRQGEPLDSPEMDQIQNEFSWSKSRHEKLSECPRAYYYQYYGSWGGWEAPNGSPARELYVLKKLSSRFQWAGSLVHDALRSMLTRAKATGQFTPM